MNKKRPNQSSLISPISDLSRYRLGPYYIRGYLKGALNKGFDPEEILKMADIPSSVYENSTSSINGEQLQRLILKIREIMNDHYMGFLLVPGKIAMDREAGKAAVQGKTLGQSLRYLNAFVNAVRSDEERTLTVEDASSQCSMCFHFTEFSEDVDTHLAYWYRLYWGYKFYCWLIGERIQLTEVHFSGPRPKDCIAYEAVFDCPIVFDQSDNKLCFDSKYLVKSVFRNNTDLLNGSFPLDYPSANWFTVPSKDFNLASQVEYLLAESLKVDMQVASIEVVSGILAVSTRTLTRRLNKEEQSFQKIKTKVRTDIAKDLLVNSNITLTQISEKIGFSEQGDFTRAFIGWAGQTPSSYRIEHTK
jgi:AraC-like DNA-binding protein